MFKVESRERLQATEGQDSIPGILLVAPRSLNLLAYNREAIQILAFPANPRQLKRLHVFLASQVRSKLVARSSPEGSPFVRDFKSGNRTYSCRALDLLFKETSAGEGGTTTMALLLERPPATGLFLKRRICEEFGLTNRESQIVELLVQGLTTKELARSMNVSPNTVKTLLHLIMTKMNVSTRSGIVGKILATKVC